MTGRHAAGRGGRGGRPPPVPRDRPPEAGRPKPWTEVEDAFVRAMEAFDANVANGVADIGELQNGKGDFLNDLLALLLEGCAGGQLSSRGGVPGAVFANHHLDGTD